MEFVKLQRRQEEVKVECIAEARRLAALMRDVSEALVDLGLPPILGIPWDPRTTGNILEEVGTLLEHVWEAYASDHSPWD
jgi:hypothetical protein